MAFDSKAAVDVTPEKNGKVLKAIEREGEGDETPWKGTEVVVHYTGCLEDGTKFDSSRDRDEPFKFNLGKGEVIKGWDVGVASMKKGEKCKLSIESEYGYGKNGSPPKIPGGATLIFDVELLEWRIPEIDVTGDKGVIMKVIKPGEGTASPNEFAQCKIHIKGTYGDKIFEERDVEFLMGEGEEVGLPKGLEKAVKKMKRYEKTHITLQPEYAFGNNFPNEYDLSPDSVVEYEVYLSQFERQKAAFDMTFEERTTKAQTLKDKATDIFKDGNYTKAIRYYERMLKYVTKEGNDDSQFETLQYLRFPAHLNSALCYLKLKEFSEAKRHCDEVLSEDENNVKGLYRRGEAYMGLHEAPVAQKDFEKLISVEPENNAAKKGLQQAKLAIKTALEKEKKLYAKMFTS